MDQFGLVGVSQRDLTVWRGIGIIGLIGMNFFLRNWFCSQRCRHNDILEGYHEWVGLWTREEVSRTLLILYAYSYVLFKVRKFNATTGTLKLMERDCTLVAEFLSLVVKSNAQREPIPYTRPPPSIGIPRIPRTLSRPFCEILTKKSY